MSLIIFDMDGTLLSTNSWVELHHCFGLEEKEDEVMVQWYTEGILTYFQWTDLISRIYKGRRIATQFGIADVLKRCLLHPEAKQLVDEVRRRGYHIAMLSGGVDVVVSDIAARLGIERFDGNHQMTFDGDGNFQALKAKNADGLFKIRMLESYCRELDILPGECLCVGDGWSDREIFSVARGILVSPTNKPAPVDNYWKWVSQLEEVVDLIPDLRVNS